MALYVVDTNIVVSGVITAGWSSPPGMVVEAMLRYVSDEDTVEGNMPPTDVPGDAHVLRLLAHEPRSALVSCDRRLVAAVEGWRPVVAAAELAVLLT